jgi:hypothetical protein
VEFLVTNASFLACLRLCLNGAAPLETLKGAAL